MPLNICKWWKGDEAVCSVAIERSVQISFFPCGILRFTCLCGFSPVTLVSSHSWKTHIRLIGDFKLLLDVSVWLNGVCPVTDCQPVQSIFLPLTPWLLWKTSAAPISMTRKRWLHPWSRCKPVFLIQHPFSELVKTELIWSWTRTVSQQVGLDWIQLYDKLDENVIQMRQTSVNEKCDYTILVSAFLHIYKVLVVHKGCLALLYLCLLN